MSNEDIIAAMMAGAISNASTSHHTVDTLETRAAYARGVRAMAGIVQACVHVADQFADQQRGHPVAHQMIIAYARGLRHIVSVADELIPQGWEP